MKFQDFPDFRRVIRDLGIDGALYTGFGKKLSLFSEMYSRSHVPGGGSGGAPTLKTCSIAYLLVSLQKKLYKNIFWCFCGEQTRFEVSGFFDFP